MIASGEMLTSYFAGWFKAEYRFSSGIRPRTAINLRRRKRVGSTAVLLDDSSTGEVTFAVTNELGNRCLRGRLGPLLTCPTIARSWSINPAFFNRLLAAAVELDI